MFKYFSFYLSFTFRYTQNHLFFLSLIIKMFCGKLMDHKNDNMIIFVLYTKTIWGLFNKFVSEVTHRSIADIILVTSRWVHRQDNILKKSVLKRQGDPPGCGQYYVAHCPVGLWANGLKHTYLLDSSQVIVFFLWQIN